MKLYKKFLIIVLFFSLIVIVMIFGAHSFLFNTTCRDLKSVLLKPELINHTASSLLAYLDDPRVREDIGGRLGKVFDLIELKYPLPIDAEDLGASFNKLPLSVKIIRENESLRSVNYEILEFGVGLGRDYLMFKHSKNQSIEFQPYVECNQE